MNSEIGARIRAAFAYANLDKTQRADVLNVSERTVRRYELGHTQIPHDAIERISNATGVPAWFFRYGFTRQPSDTTDTDTRLANLEAQMGLLLRRIAAGAPPAPPTAHQHPQQAPHTTSTTHDHENPQAADSD